MKAKKSRQKRKSGSLESKRNFTPLITIAIIGGFLLLIFFLFAVPQESDEWTVSNSGLLHYPENRGKVEATVLETEKGINYTLETISFQSKDYTVEGLLRIPVSENKVPAVVILPGATVPKEGTQGLARIFSDMGIASFGIEQRNRGGVNVRYDYELYVQDKEPVEHKMVYDALRAVDTLKQDPRIDKNKIAILGESNGGRFAIIAAAIDPSISGVIGISTSGYNSEAEIINIRDETAIRFYRSIDPETYLGTIPPRKFVMLHSINDTIIPIDLAKNTYNKAKEPKQFYEVKTGTHGFSEGMRIPLENEIKVIFR